MRIFAIASAVPCRRPGEDVAAVHVVSYELLAALKRLGHEVFFQGLGLSGPAIGAREEQDLDHLGELGMEVLSPLRRLPSVGVEPSSRLGRVGRRLRSLMGGGIEDFYPALRHREQVRAKVRSARPDVILMLWSPEGVAATHGIRETPRIAYHGDVDFRPAEVRLRDRGLFAEDGLAGDQGFIRRGLGALKGRLWLAGIRRAHLALMAGVHVIANVTASNAAYYSRQGHPRSIYVGNTWTDAGAEAAQTSSRRQASADRTLKIIGHVGGLRQTGSTYGLRCLLVDVLPSLEKLMQGLDYRIHIIGAGEVAPALRPWVRHERVVLRGFVEDLDGELRSARAFLVLNNAAPYLAAYTRHIVAWSMGLCLVVHSNSAKAIPEMRHMDNALAGSTPREIAEMIRLAVTDTAINRRIRSGGRTTYEKHFAPAIVARALMAEMERLVGRA